ncbi:MAG: VWA domain-containing protein [Promethearchaeota archaeon]
MQDFKIEDTVILLDTSRSMLRKDFKPDRLTVAIKTVKKFIQSKFMIDPKDRILIICFGDTTKKLTSFTNEEEKLFSSLKRFQISGKGLIHEAIAFALQLLVDEMRKIGGKIPRIFIISDDKLKNDLNKLKKILNIAKGLGIFIDSCQLGKTEDYKESTLKKIAQMTGGEYGYFTNSKAAINAGKSFASKKPIKDSSEYLSPSQKEKTPPLISEIALSLRRPTVMEVRLMMSGRNRRQEKCQICHSTKSPITNKDFYTEGRYCPACDRPMHLSCAGMWAQKSEYKENIFRCPFCFFLLELPPSILKIIKNTKSSKQKIKIIRDEKEVIKETIMHKVPENEVDEIIASCSYCHSIFSKEMTVYRCSKCGVFYHKPCLQKMYDEIKSCRNCGSNIKFDF